MYIYNVTINIEESVHDQWLAWMKKEYIPKMLSTGKFEKALMSKVLVKEEMGGITYAVQYFVESKEMLRKYYEENAKDMRKNAKAFEGKYVTFQTEMEIISEH